MIDESRNVTLSRCIEIQVGSERHEVEILFTLVLALASLVFVFTDYLALVFDYKRSRRNGFRCTKAPTLFSTCLEDANIFEQPLLKALISTALCSLTGPTRTFNE